MCLNCFCLKHFSTPGAFWGKIRKFDLNAPSGASTAAPYFGAWRLLQLLAFSGLQDSDQMFDVCVFACVRFLHISADICMFLMFSVGSVRARRLCQPANFAAKNASEIVKK